MQGKCKFLSCPARPLFIYAKEKLSQLGLTGAHTAPRGGQQPLSGVHARFCAPNQPEPSISPPNFFPLGEVRAEGKKLKSKEEIKKIVPRFLRGITTPKYEPHSLHLPEFYRAYNHPLGIEPNHINSVSSISTELRILKLIQGGFTSPKNTVVKNAIGNNPISQNETDPCVVKVNFLQGTSQAASPARTGFSRPVWGRPGLGRP